MCPPGQRAFPVGAAPSPGAGGLVKPLVFVESVRVSVSVAGLRGLPVALGEWQAISGDLALSSLRDPESFRFIFFPFLL